MEPEGSLPNSQVHATCLYPEPAQSSPYHTSYFFKIQLNIIPHLRLGLPSGLFPSGFPIKTLYKLLPSPSELPSRPSHSSRFYNLNFIIIIIMYTYARGPGSSVGIVTGYGLDVPGIESRWGETFRTRPDRLWDPASCTMGTGSFPGVKRPGRGADHPPPPSSEVENE
jgi:hypothetical protein